MWASFPRIGLAFERDHSSVIHACKMVALRRARDREFAQLVDDLERELSNGRDRGFAASGRSSG